MSAADQVRLTLMIARGEQLLIVELPSADGGGECALPSCILEQGESLAACARAIAREAVTGTLTHLMFQRVLLLPDHDGTQQVILGLYTEVAPGDADPLPPWRFVHRDALPSRLERATALAIAQCRNGWTALDLDGTPLPIGFGLSLARANALDEVAAMKRSRVPWRAGLASAGAAAWAVAAGFGVLARSQGDPVRSIALAPHLMILGAILAGMFFGRRSSFVGTVSPFSGIASSALALAVTAALLGVGAALGGGDAARIVFWVGCLGAATSLIVWPKRGSVGLWLLAWSAAVFVTTSFTLPPLGDALYGDGRTAAPPASEPASGGLDDG